MARSQVSSGTGRRSIAKRRSARSWAWSSPLRAENEQLEVENAAGAPLTVDELP